MDLTQETLGALARDLPDATTVLLRHRLDFCCGGERTLGAACASAGLDAAVIAAELDAASRRSTEPPPAWAQMPLVELCDHIEARYHQTLRDDVPPLIAAAHKVERVHAGKPAVPTGLGAGLQHMWNELQSHMMKEERVLFPMIRQGQGAMAHAPVQVMRHEHDEHAVNLRGLRALTGDHVPPPHACATWRALYAGLARLERELMEHIHLENHVLFPRALGR
ncbi:MAG: iron-sulfur cluster repair protein YtfE [Kofleriaceae bacterium]|jgi:regulator of cell morphogenesis and NO signaling|nr:iron-sulfur cluster repair protein YtfE [Kofleriaceae bacterium]MBP6835933.1 iron-sulfur cluster repair protein YtfE [Kofleriaceae bacterium]MBP9203028.1 iron-sulfur cluster repair protein YtfE [Kofleriaceae bacterium]